MAEYNNNKTQINKRSSLKARALKKRQAISLNVAMWNISMLSWFANHKLQLQTAEQMLHRMKITEFLYLLDFIWNQFRGFLKCKIYHFITFDFYDFLHFKRLKCAKSTKFGTFIMAKMQFLQFTESPNWFDVKSDRQKIPYCVQNTRGNRKLKFA